MTPSNWQRASPVPVPVFGPGRPTANSYWWSSLPAERSWVEIRRVAEGLGQELRCPFVNAVGRRDGWWELVDDVRAGDCIYHWNADQGRFIGRSFAATARHIDAGTGERVVRLKDFLPLVVDVGLEQVRALAPQLEAARDAITEQHPGATPYLPFQFRSDGLRLMSNYFTKLPLAMEQILFGSDGLAESGLQPPPTEDPDDPELEGSQRASGRPGGSFRRSSPGLILIMSRTSRAARSGVAGSMRRSSMTSPDGSATADGRRHPTQRST